VRGFTRQRPYCNSHAKDLHFASALGADDDAYYPLVPMAWGRDVYLAITSRHDSVITERSCVVAFSTPHCQMFMLKSTSYIILLTWVIRSASADCASSIAFQGYQRHVDYALDDTSRTYTTEYPLTCSGHSNIHLWPRLGFRGYAPVLGRGGNFGMHQLPSRSVHKSPIYYHISSADA
jgi:hypothetical protein